eukprot:1137381-Pelagomonas_calceolata.AAC.7
MPRKVKDLLKQQEISNITKVRLAACREPCLEVEAILVAPKAYYKPFLAYVFMTCLQGLDFPATSH